MTARIVLAIRQAMQEFLTLSSIHGIKYIKEAPNLFLRLLWLAVWTTMVAFAVLTAKSLWVKYMESTVAYEVEDVGDARNITLLTFALCNVDVEWNASTCHDIYQNCTLNDTPVDCCIYFVPIVSEFPYCHILNSMQLRKDNSPDQVLIFPENKTLKLTYQFKWHGQLIRSISTSNFEVPLEQGFGSSQGTTTGGKYGFDQRHETESIVIDEIADENVRNIPIESRNCRFPEENENMWAFPYYSFSACIAQCKAELKMKLCNCTDVFIGIIKGQQILCGKSGLLCIEGIQDKLEPVNTFEFKSNGLNCQCDRSCLQKDIIPVKSISTKEKIKPGEYATHSHVVKLGKKRRRMIVVRGMTDIAISIGGVFGLFLGASVMSVFEVIYYILVRPIFILYGH